MRIRRLASGLPPRIDPPDSGTERARSQQLTGVSAQPVEVWEHNRTEQISVPANPEPPQIPDGRQDDSKDDLGPDRPGRPWSLLILAIVVVWLGLERLHDDRELAVELLLVGAFLTALFILPAGLRKLVSRYWPFWRD